MNRYGALSKFLLGYSISSSRKYKVSMENFIYIPGRVRRVDKRQWANSVKNSSQMGTSLGEVVHVISFLQPFIGLRWGVMLDINGRAISICKTALLELIIIRLADSRGPQRQISNEDSGKEKQN